MHKLAYLSLAASILLGSAMQGVHADAAPAGAAPEMQGTITQNRVVRQGTPAYQAIARFLVDATEGHRHRSLDNAGVEPDYFRINSVRAIEITQAVRQPPTGQGSIPLPSGRHNAGDTYAIGTCGNGISEHWTFRYDLAGTDEGWVLNQYRYARVDRCEPVD